MKSSVDLTENRDFSKRNLYSPSHKKFKHKQKPWNKPKNNINDEMDINYMFNYFGNNLDDYANSFYYTKKIGYGYSINTGYINCEINPSKSRINLFPLGKAPDIRKNRGSHTITPKYQQTKKPCIRCKRLFVVTPWSKKSYEGYTCDLCIDKKVKKNSSKENRSDTKRIFNMFGSNIFGYVPCLSTNLPKEKKVRKYPKRCNAYLWDDNDLLDELDHIRGVKQKKTKIQKKSVYYKGIKVRNDDFPWQPEGRKIQEYDQLFDNTDWRDFLRKRLGNLDRDHLLSYNRSSINRININMHDFNIWYNTF